MSSDPWLFGYYNTKQTNLNQHVKRVCYWSRVKNKHPPSTIVYVTNQEVQIVHYDNSWAVEPAVLLIDLWNYILVLADEHELAFRAQFILWKIISEWKMSFHMHYRTLLLNYIWNLTKSPCCLWHAAKFSSHNPYPYKPLQQPVISSSNLWKTSEKIKERVKTEFSALITITKTRIQSPAKS